MAFPLVTCQNVFCAKDLQVHYFLLQWHFWSVPSFELATVFVFSADFDPHSFPCPLAEQQYVSDVLCLIDHGDPQIRGATAILCGAIIQAALTKTRYNIHTWLARVQSSTG